jgi:hypothetical protein
MTVTLSISVSANHHDCFVVVVVAGWISVSVGRFCMKGVCNDRREREFDRERERANDGTANDTTKPNCLVWVVTVTSLKHSLL